MKAGEDAVDAKGERHDVAALVGLHEADGSHAGDQDEDPEADFLAEGLTDLLQLHCAIALQLASWGSSKTCSVVRGLIFSACQLCLQSRTTYISLRLGLVFEDTYGIVAVIVYESMKQLLSEWTEAQSALVGIISKYVERTDAKASEGYLVLLTPAGLPTTDRDAAMRIRYDTGRVRKLLGTGEDLHSLQDLQTIVAPLLPLDIGPGTSPTESSLDVLPKLLAEQGVEESSVRTVVEAYRSHDLLVEAIYKGLP